MVGRYEIKDFEREWKRCKTKVKLVCVNADDVCIFAEKYLIKGSEIHLYEKDELRAFITDMITVHVKEVSE